MLLAGVTAACDPFVAACKYKVGSVWCCGSHVVGMQGLRIVHLW